MKLQWRVEIALVEETETGDVRVKHAQVVGGESFVSYAFRYLIIKLRQAGFAVEETSHRVSIVSDRIQQAFKKVR